MPCTVYIESIDHCTSKKSTSMAACNFGVTCLYQTAAPTIYRSSHFSHRGTTLKSKLLGHCSWGLRCPIGKFIAKGLTEEILDQHVNMWLTWLTWPQRHFSTHLGHAEGEAITILRPWGTCSLMESLSVTFYPIIWIFWQQTAQVDRILPHLPHSSNAETLHGDTFKSWSYAARLSGSRRQR